MGMKQMGMKQQQLRAGNRRPTSNRRAVRVQAKTGEDHKGKWRALDVDESDDQQDIQRGRGMADGLFQGEDAGNEGTHNVVLQSADYDSGASRKLEFLDDDYYCSPHFMDKVTLHLVKNYLADILPKIKIPLILGVWGGKGQGKTFQAELIFKKLKMEPVVMAAGELESGNAGEPAKLIRQRYREAADMIKKGTMTALFINDLDAGAGRMGGSTQYTVNNQLVNATLMNIADNPTNVQLPGQYNQEEINRVPVVATGNDFSTLYAPLIRDGRMEKFYWSPTRDDRVGVVMGIFKDDGVDQKAAEVLVDTFQGQTIDFFGALRSRIYDDKIREFVENTGFEKLKKRLTNPSYEERNKTFEKPDMSLQTLLAYGRQLEQEQENVRRVQLADDYMYSAGLGPEESREAEGALLG